MDGALWAGRLTVAQVITNFANATVFNFSTENEISLQRITDNGLLDDLTIV